MRTRKGRSSPHVGTGQRQGMLGTDPGGQVKSIPYDDVAGIIGAVAGPATSTDNAIARFDGLTGKRIQDSTAILQDDGRISSLTDPTSAQDAATKAYVDALVSVGVRRGTVRVATTVSITIATALNNGDSLDGVTLATGDLVLVKDQAAPEQNGVYVVGVSPARAAEFDTYDEHPGALLVVQEGTTNADTVWLCTSNKGGTLNTTAIVFSAFTVGASSITRAITFAINGGGAVIALGIGADIQVPYAATITGWTLLGDQSGSAVVDIWKDTYANYPPTVADSITAAAKPTVTAAMKATSTTLTGWTTSITAGDILRFNVDSASGFTRLVLVLAVTT